MIIKNSARKTTLTTHARLANSLKQKSIGLLGTKEPQALIFHTRWGIHTIGMKYPIDVLILDDKGTVVTMKQFLKPNKIFLWNPKYHTVIELPEGLIKKTKTEIGDILDLVSR